MTRTEKYNFKIQKNQHKVDVPLTWEDSSEKNTLDLFEACCLNLKNRNYNQYSMIELGSNWCYYSLLFKHILGKEKTLNIMVEPIEDSLQLGRDHFALNNCEGIFYQKGITDTMEYYGKQIKLDSISLDEILKQNTIICTDILHADIDCCEVTLIEKNIEFFQEGKAKNIFILTHGDYYANTCKEYFKQFPYNLVAEYPYGTQCGDGLLVYKLSTNN